MTFETYTIQAVYNILYTSYAGISQQNPCENVVINIPCAASPFFAPYTGYQQFT